MQMIPPRLNHLLHLLLRSKEPVSVQELGSRLGVSRRTVFRELENVDTLLRPFDLLVGTITGKGMLLEGSEEGRNRLRKELDSAGNLEPAGRQERQSRLALALLLTPESQKLFYFSDLLRVSEATISNDLDRMEAWFRGYRLTLIRKQSYGVAVEGTEACIRRACVAILLKQEDAGQEWVGIPRKEIVDGLAACSERLNWLCGWMTPESQVALWLYLLVMTQRILDGYEVEAEAENSGHAANAAEIAELLEAAFPITVSQQERWALSVELSSCRNNTTAIPHREGNRDTQLLHLSYQLIEAFDPAIASVLKLDEDLLDGLVFHLRSALVRLEIHMELQDPLLEQIVERYPDLMQKTTQAARLLTGEDGWLPENEISFLAMHFGAAIHRLEERGIRRRAIHIGIVCINGIGTSYLLAAQVRQHFEADAKIEVSGWEAPEEWKRYDLVISTISLKNTDVPVIVVPPFLEADSIAYIREEIDRRSLLLHQEAPQQQKGDSPALRFAKLRSLSGDLETLLEQFDGVSVESDCSFEGLAKLAGYRFGDSERNGRLIYEGLLEREKMSSQVVTEMGIVLLHCLTDGIAGPVFAMISPEGGRFTDPYFGGVRSCVLLLMPRQASRERTELMGGISSAMVENEGFLEAILANDKDLVYSHLEMILLGHCNNYLEKNWKDEFCVF